MNIHGLIVGIEKYNEPTWDVRGPVTNAIEMAKWLSSIGTPPGNIHLFLHTTDAKDRRIAGLRKAGFDVRPKVDSGTIDTFWRSELKRDVPAGARLFSFWSGHGFTSKKRNRIFFCPDFESDTFRKRVFNATEYLNTLLTANFSCFTDQIVLADVCGVYDRIPVQDDTPELDMEERSQLGFFATPEGQYASGRYGLGEFTSVVLKVLKQQNGWPAQQAFANALETAFRDNQVKPFRVSGFINTREYREEVAGGSPRSGNPPIDDLFDRLRGLDVTDEVFGPHFRKTVDDLGNPDLAKAQGLMGALKILSTLRDERLPNQFTRGLLQFVLRMGAEPSLTGALNQWLDTYAGGQANTLNVLRAKLNAESRNRILVVVVEADGKERVAAFKAFLCNGDASLVNGWKFERQKVASWVMFTRRLQELLAQFLEGGALTNIQIHFAVDAPLFDRAFHKIPVAKGGRPIGHDAIVVVRSRGRLFSSDNNLKRVWFDYAKDLGEKRTGALKWIKLSLDKEIPSEQGLFLATFTLPEPATDKRSSSDEKMIIDQLLKLGVPYVYLPHSLPPKGGWAAVTNELKRLLSKNAALVAFPSELKAARLRKNAIGVEGSMIWDDPLAVPVGLTEGVTFG